MREVIKELDRRGVFRIAAAYIILSWMVLQVINVIRPTANLPDIVFQIVFLFQLVCFPLVVWVAWAFDMTEEGLKMDINIRRENAARDLQSQVIKSIVEYQDRPEAESQRGKDGVSMAVLPFRNVGDDPEDSYLPGGIAEEIRNILYAADGVYVVGRSSSRAIVTQGFDSQKIGELLHVHYVLSGSVKRIGEKLSVRARLIKVDSGFEIWSSSYERDLRNIFQLQEEIVEAVARELKLPIAKAEREEKTKRLTSNEKAYGCFMRGRSHLVTRLGDNLSKAIRLFECAVEADPGFARAWAGLGEAHAVLPAHQNVNMSEAQAAAERCCRQAVLIDAKFAAPYGVLAQVFTQHRAYTMMQSEIDKGLACDPRDRTVLHYAGISMINVGRIDLATEYFYKLREEDPMMPFALAGLSVCKFIAGDFKKAEEYASRVIAIGYVPANMTLAEIAAVEGEKEKAVALLEQALKTGIVKEFSHKEIAILARGVFLEEARAEALSLVEEYVRDPAPETEDFAPFFLLRYGKVEEALDVFARNKFAFDAYFYAALWSHTGDEARRHPAIKPFLRRVGLVDYWRQFGWPEKCSELDGNDFEVR